MPAFEYAPAPESRAIVDLKPSYGLFIDGEFVDRSTAARSRRSTRRPRRCWPRSPRPARPTSTARSPRPARAYDKVWGRDARRASGPSTSTGSPASSRSAPASWPCWSRSTTASRSASPATSTCRWSPRTSSTTRAGPTSSPHAGFGADPRPLGVAGQVIPWNFPLLMLAWKIAPALAARQHRGAQAGRDDAADRAAVRRDLPAGRPAAGRGQHRHRRRRDRAGAGRAPRRGQGGVHRLDRGRPRDRPVGRRHAARRSPWSWAARRPTSSSTTRRSTRPSRASSTASSSTRATSAAPGSRLLVQESVYDDGAGVAEAPDGAAAGRRPAGQEHRHRRDQLGRAAGPDPDAVRHRRRGGRRALVAAVRAARPRVLVRADHLHRRHPGAPDRPRGDLRAGAVGADVPHARPRRSRRPTTRRTGCRPASGPTRARGSSGWPTSCAPAWCGPTRSTSSTRRRRSAATRSRATAARAAGTGWRRTSAV